MLLQILLRDHTLPLGYTVFHWPEKSHGLCKFCLAGKETKQDPVGLLGVEAFQTFAHHWREVSGASGTCPGRDKVTRQERNLQGSSCKPPSQTISISSVLPLFSLSAVRERELKHDSAWLVTFKISICLRNTVYEPSLSTLFSVSLLHWLHGPDYIGAD